VTDVAGEPVIVGGEEGGGVPPPLGALATTILNDASEAEAVPFVTVMMMFESVPTSPLPGVPVSAPVLELKLVHDGSFCIENVSVLPAGSLALGVKL